MNSTRLAFVDSKSGKTYHGTVKYSGAVAPTAGDWLGVEWDDETRGKHDGVYSPTGVRYFYCDVAGAGSFIRPSAPGISFGISFGPALRLKYTPELASDLNDPSPATRSEFYSTASNFKIEVVSSSKVDSNTRRLSRLRDVGLAGEGVSHAGDDEELDAVTAELTSVQTLDLSNSLLYDFSEVVRVCARLPTLRTLLLNSNRFSITALTDPSGMVNLTTLHLNKTLIRWTEIVSFSSSLPSLEDLQIGSNRIRNLSLEATPILNFPNLRTLNLEGNLLESWDEVKAVLEALPRLETLIITSNSISSISAPATRIKSSTSKLSRLEISHNQLSGWESVDALNQYGLTSLWIDGNPFEADHSEEKLRAIIIAKVGSLAQLQGSSISLAERNDSETFYLSMIAKGDDTLTGVGLLHPRLAELSLKHGGVTSVSTEPTNSIPPIVQSTIHSKLIRITINLPPELLSPPTPLVLSILPTLATRLLRTKIAKSLGKPTSELSRSKWRLVGYLSAPPIADDSTTSLDEAKSVRGESRAELRWEIPVNEEGRELSWWGLLDGDRVEIVPL